VDRYRGGASAGMSLPVRVPLLCPGRVLVRAANRLGITGWNLPSIKMCPAKYFFDGSRGIVIILAERAARTLHSVD